MISVADKEILAGLNDSVGGMTEHALRVALFAIKGGQFVPAHPHMPRADVRKLRCLLLLEETLEFIEASGFAVDLYSVFSGVCKVGERFGYTVYETGKNPSYEDMVDACADVSVVNTGTLIALGAGDAEVLEAVDNANLAKVTGNVTRDANGKIKKPDDWQPPVYGCVNEFKLMCHFLGSEQPEDDSFGEGIEIEESEVNLQ